MAGRGCDDQRIDRREFLVAGAAGMAGLWGAGLGNAAVEPLTPGVKRYVPLGRTGLSISDISFGSSRMRDPAAVRHAFERGVNYFDSAEGYKGGDSETAIGEALHDVRDRVYLTSKTKAEADSTRAEMMAALEGSLRRLRTDRVDIYFNHAVNHLDRMKNDEWAEFTEIAKKQGKIRFRGMSGHGAQLVECLEYSLDHDLVDVILVAYNFGQDPAFISRFLDRFDFIALQPNLPPLLTRAHAKGVGVVAMKTLMGARVNDMRPYETPGSTFAQAAFRWTLSNPDVDALVISMNDAAMIDEYLGASGARSVGRRDRDLLGRYAALFGSAYCQHGCDRCADRCPNGVEIAEVLRTRMYDTDYGDRELARSDYGVIERDASPCLSCSGGPCASACPNGIPISALTRDTALRLG